MLQLRVGFGLCEAISRRNASAWLVQRLRLAIGFLLRDLPALVREHQPPADHAADQQQRHQRLAQRSQAQR